MPECLQVHGRSGMPGPSGPAIPGITIRLTDFGAFSKTYFVDKATHKISASGGYTTAAEMHKAEGNTDDAGAGNSGGPDERF